MVNEIDANIETTSIKKAFALIIGSIFRSTGLMLPILSGLTPNKLKNTPDKTKAVTMLNTSVIRYNKYFFNKRNLGIRTK
jgi:hypothetical protein